MRFGISATSGMFPKNLRTRLRPLKVWVWAIVAPCCLSWGAASCALQLLTALPGGPSETGENPFPESRFPALRKEVFQTLARHAHRGGIGGRLNAARQQA